MTDLHDLELLLRSETPILLIETLEERRLLELFTRLGLALAEPVFCWTLTDGLRRIEYQTSPQRHLAEPAEALKHVKATSQPGIYLLLDFHPFLDHPLHVRLLKEIGQAFDARLLPLPCTPSSKMPFGRSLPFSADRKAERRRSIHAFK